MLEIELVDFSGDPLRLLHLLPESKHLDGSLAACGLDLARRSRQFMGCYSDGRSEDRLRDSERCRENNALRGPPVVREVCGKPRNVLDIGAAEAVDRLVGIGGGSEVPVFSDEALKQHRLCMGGVLILVHE